MTFQPFFKNPMEAVTNMLDKTPLLLCKQDKLINKADPSKSVIVTKVRAMGTTATAAPRVANGRRRRCRSCRSPRCSAAEMDCLEWWAHEVSK